MRGSSPHTRGAPLDLPPSVFAARIIPAYAGSTSRRATQSRPEPDHPRIRGEHGLVARRTIRGGGSSPHTRGARYSSSGRGEYVRIIPAYAGSTRSIRQYPRRPKDHPRIRGEHTSRRPLSTYPCGSSPHTRGAPMPLRSRSRRPRIIPAYAGSTT